jgi:hypothetical protein
MMAASARHDGRWEKLTGEDKTCATKRAFKRQFEGVAMSPFTDTVQRAAAPNRAVSDSKLLTMTQRFLPSWLELRPKPIETETIESEEAA